MWLGEIFNNGSTRIEVFWVIGGGEKLDCKMDKRQYFEFLTMEVLENKSYLGYWWWRKVVL